ncbi:MAG: hypothetical protein F2534_10085 [Actinobacteria bacterium]|nr:hypothetical protein [Actinomycetota bacterium]
MRPAPEPSGGLGGEQIERGRGEAVEGGEGGEAVEAVEAGDAHTWWWFADDHELRLPEPRLAGGLVSSGDGHHVRTLTGTTVVRDLVVDPARLVPGASVDRAFVTTRPGRTERFLIEAPCGTWPAHLGVDALVERSVIRSAAAPRAGG